jgi:branched-chain amino acid transport system permease protein
MNWFKRKNLGYIVWACSLLGFALLPYLVGPAWVSVATEMLIMALAASSLNILVGGCGVVSFGHAGFFAVGAYTFSLMMYYNVAPFGVSFAAAPLSSGLFALFCGYFCVKMVEVYFALLVLAFSQVVYVVIFSWYDFTKGDDGISGVPIPAWILSQEHCYWFVLLVVFLSLLVIRMITKSSFGGAINAMRENKDRVMFIGVNPKKYLLIAFVMSGFFMGIAGTLMSIFMRAAFPGFSSFMKSGEFLLVCLMGGVTNFLGPSVGAVVYILLDKTLSAYTEYWPMLMGFLLVFITLFMRGGIVESLIRLWKIRPFRGRKDVIEGA